MELVRASPSLPGKMILEIFPQVQSWSRTSAETSTVVSFEESSDELLASRRPHPLPPLVAGGAAPVQRSVSAAGWFRAKKLGAAALAASVLAVIACCLGLRGASAILPTPSFAHPRGRELTHEAPPRPSPEPPPQLLERWQTAPGLGKFQRLPPLELGPDVDTAPGPTVDVFPSAQDQTILGFGGAFTESSAVVFKQLSERVQEELLSLYFGPDGLGLTLGRVHINSCDFSEASYNFDAEWNDYNLTFFDEGVVHDTEALIPLIRRAGRAIQRAGNRLRLLATPWSPPPWMKANSKMLGSVNYPGGGLLKQARAPWARYIAKWVSAYKAHGVPIWAITVQNEPGFNAPWEACTFTAEEEAEFLGGFLGPIMRERHPDVAILTYDHNKDRVYDFARAGYRHPTAGQYIDGVAFHWYTGDQFENVAAVHRDYPQALLLPTEATYERHRWDDSGGAREGAASHGNGTTPRPAAAGPSENWSFGEGYAHDIIGDLNAGASGWIDWNLLLDERGGPNHAHNFCDAAVVADVGAQVLHLHPQYYFLGHFSKFISPGSTRIAAKVRGSSVFGGAPRPYGTCTGEDGLQAVAALRPDRKVAVVVLNCGNATIPFKLRVGGKAAQADVPAHAIQTYVLPAPAKVQF